MTIATIGEAAGKTYAGQNDTYINESAPTLNYDASSGLFLVSSASAGNRKHGLVIFTGLSNISPAVSVSDVVLQLRKDTASANANISFYRVKVPWTASQVTWNLRSTGVSWTSNGGFNSTDIDTTPIATFNLTTGTDIFTIGSNSALNALIEGWLNGSIPNYGLLVARDTDTAYDGITAGLRGSGGSDASKPLLTVTYTTIGSYPTVTSNPDVSVVEGGTATHTVTLSSTTTVPTYIAASIAPSGANPAAGGTDFNNLLATASYGSSGVTWSSGVFAIPTGVLAFPIGITTNDNALDTADKTYTLTVGGVASICTITDNDAPPSISITPSITVDGGDSVVLTCTLGAVSGRVTQARLVLTDGTKVGGVDYTNVITDGMFTTVSGSGTVTISGGVLSIPAGVVSFTITIPTTP